MHVRGLYRIQDETGDECEDWGVHEEEDEEEDYEDVAPTTATVGTWMVNPLIWFSNSVFQILSHLDITQNLQFFSCTVYCLAIRSKRETQRTRIEGI